MADPRTKAIDDVREILSRAPKGPPPRTCPSCGSEHATLSPTCPSCDKRYDRRFPHCRTASAGRSAASRSSW